MSYNLTYLDSANNLLKLVQGTHTVLDGLPSILFIVLIFVAGLAVFRNREFIDNWNMSSFITIILTTLAWFISLVEWSIVIVPISFLVLGLMVKFVSNR